MMLASCGARCSYAYPTDGKTYAITQVEKGTWMLGEMRKKPFARFNSKRAAVNFYRQMSVKKGSLKSAAK